MLETVKSEIYEKQNSPITFEQAFVENMMRVQDEMIEQEMKSLDRLNAELTPNQLNNLIAKTNTELRSV